MIDRDELCQVLRGWLHGGMHMWTGAAADAILALDKRDERDIPKQCPKCKQWCVYDGWDWSHAYGDVGIGSCNG